MSGGSDTGLLIVQRMSQSEEIIRNEVKIEGSCVLYVSDDAKGDSDQEN